MLCSSIFSHVSIYRMTCVQMILTVHSGTVMVHVTYLLVNVLVISSILTFMWVLYYQLVHILLVTWAWFPLNVSVLATNRSCLLVRTLLHFAGFHRQPSLGLLRGLLYLELCESRSVSSIELKVTTFRKSLLFSLFLALLFFSEDRKSF